MKAAFAALLLTAGLALVVFLYLSEKGRPTPPADTWIDTRAIHEESRRLDETVARLSRFHAVMRQVEDGLLAGALTLEEAADTVLESARSDNARLLEWVRRNVSAGTDRERMMRVLLGRFQAVEAVGLLSPVQKEHLDCLRCEFEGVAAAYRPGKSESD